MGTPRGLNYPLGRPPSASGPRATRRCAYDSGGSDAARRRFLIDRRESPATSEHDDAAAYVGGALGRPILGAGAERVARHVDPSRSSVLKVCGSAAPRSVPIAPLVEVRTYVMTDDYAPRLKENTTSDAQRIDATAVPRSPSRWKKTPSISKKRWRRQARVTRRPQGQAVTNRLRDSRLRRCRQNGLTEDYIQPHARVAS